ncbi:MAG: sensor histidine kinase [Lachnospiraceae bacterium]|nr:sensor histidine kinase [Lachnospiraceae bacterium]
MKKLGFREKMTAAILLVAALGILLVSGVNYLESKRQITQSYVSYIDNKASVQLQKFEKSMQEAYLNITEISCSGELKKTIREYVSGDGDFEAGQKVSDTLRKKLTSKQYDNALYLYIPKTSEMFSTQDYYDRQVMDRSNILIWRRKQDEPFVPLFFMNYFTGSAEYVLAYADEIIYDDEGNKGYLCMTLNERQIFYDLIAPLNNNENGETYRLITPRGLIASSEETGQLGCMMKDRSCFGDYEMQAVVNENNLLACSVRSNFTGYYFYCESSMQNPKAALNSRLKLVFSVLLLAVLVIIAISTSISEYMYGPIGALAKTMKKIQGGNFAARVDEKDMNDEFLLLGRGFNNMMDHMDDLMDNIVQERTEKREAEINALQYQIRPHFMYNTLNSIRFAAQLQRNQKLADLLGDFIGLLEASIQRKGAFITVKEEIDLVKSFIDLQAFRYFDCFETEYHIDPEAEGCYVPCLLMQPMVENAVFHGIDTTKNDNLISIDVWLEEDHLRLSIRDNGGGFEEQSLWEDGRDKRRLTGIGLNNVKERLALYYGEKAYFVIHSEIGKGTTVEFTLPKSTDPEEYSIKKEGEKI